MKTKSVGQKAATTSRCSAALWLSDTARLLFGLDLRPLDQPGPTP